MYVRNLVSTMQDTRKTKALLHMHEIKIPKVLVP